MDITPFLHFAHDSWLGHFAREQFWVFTTGLIIHFLGLSLLLGGMLVVDLRLLGFIRFLPPGAALKALPIAILGFTLNLLTGIVMFCFDPVAYWANPAFKIKMVLVMLAGLNALWFTFAEHRHLVHAPGDHHTPLNVKISAALSLLLWFLVIVGGRMIVAFQGSPDLFK